MSETVEAEAVVIGAGIIGAAITLGLARTGLKTICIDRLPAAGYGSTSGSCAIIRPYYSTFDGTALAYESHFYWSDWARYLDVNDERGFANYNNCGITMMKTPQNGHLIKMLELMSVVGVPYEELTVEQLLERLPMVSTDCFSPAKRPNDPLFGKPNGDSVSGAVFFACGGYVSDPQLATHNVQRAAESEGAEFQFNKDVTNVLQRDNRVCGVELNSSVKVHAPIVVNVSGPHSYKINRLAGVDQSMKIKTKALRHEVAHVPAPAGVNFEKQGCIISDNDTATYSRPETGNHILVGSEDPACDEQTYVDPDNYNKDLSDQSKVQIMRAAQRIQDLGIPEQAKGVVDLYDVSDDWIPIYDKSDLPGYYMAIGTSGNQFKNAPIVGEMMASLISACEKGIDHDVTPVEFSLKHIQRTINLGFYSRNRDINPDSSFSVLG